MRDPQPEAPPPPHTHRICVWSTLQLCRECSPHLHCHDHGCSSLAGSVCCETPLSNTHRVIIPAAGPSRRRPPFLFRRHCAVHVPRAARAPIGPARAAPALGRAASLLRRILHSFCPFRCWCSGRSLVMVAVLYGFSASVWPCSFFVLLICSFLTSKFGKKKIMIFLAKF